MTCHKSYARCFLVYFFFGLTQLVSSLENPLVGALYEAKCTSESVELANSNHLSSILRELCGTAFFRLAKVNLNSDQCPFNKKSKEPAPSCGPLEDEEDETSFSSSSSASSSSMFGGPKKEEKPEALCSLKGIGAGPDAGFGLSTPKVFETDDVDRSLTNPENEAVLLNEEQPCHDPNLGEFWLDLCKFIPSDSSEYINLQLNPERRTGYNGSAVWDAIYRENCFSNKSGLEESCYEEKVLYRMLSGMHTSTNVHIALNYYPPIKGKRTQWETNPALIKPFLDNPDWVKNLHFSFVVLFRAVHRAAPILRKFDYHLNGVDIEEEKRTERLIEHFLDSRVMNDCATVFDAFDETLFFDEKSSDKQMLKRQFKGVFQNITKVLDCVSCEKCKLHGKIQLLGIGAALKILLLPENLLVKSISQDEIVAVINTLQKVSSAISTIPILTILYETDLQSKTTGKKKQNATNTKGTKGTGNTNNKDSNNENKKPNNHNAGTSITNLNNKRDGVTENENKNGRTNDNTSNNGNTAVEGRRSIETVYRDMDSAIDYTASFAREGLIDANEENLLIDAALAGHGGLLSLVKNYGKDSSRFLKHFRRNVDRLTAQMNQKYQSSAVGSGAPPRIPHVVIVGSGLAGLSCALTLLDRGIKVTLIDKNAVLGGNSAKASSGINGVCEPQAKSVNDSIDLFTSDMLKTGFPSVYEQVKENEGKYFEPEYILPDEVSLLALLTNSSGESVEWVQERTGVKLDQVGQLGGHSVPRTHRPSEGIAGAELVFALQRSLDKFVKNVPVEKQLLTYMKGKKVTSLVKDDSGTIVGANWVDSKKPKETGKIESDFVVIATGGFGFSFDKEGNFDTTSLLNKHRPDLSIFPTTNGKWATGDGHVMMDELQAKTVDMKQVQVHPTAFVDMNNRKAPVKTLCAEILRGVGGIMVNKNGKRFSNELGARDYLSGIMMAEAKKQDNDSEFNLILNEKIANIATKHVPLYIAKGLLFKFDTLKETAGWLNLKPDILMQTLEEYNQNAVEGKDAFGKTTFNSVPFPVKISEGPFYVGKVTPAVHYCMGGIGIDVDGKVLSETDGQPIQGLYAAGEVVGGIHGKNRLGGNALTECIVLGRIVGKSIPGLISTGDSDDSVYNEQQSSTIDDNEQENDSEPEAASQLPIVTLEEVAKHNKEGDLWVVLYGKVYDFTDFVEDHPGGAESITNIAGMDGTENYVTIHTPDLLDDFEPVAILKK